MDQTTVQTIIEGGILVALVWIGSSTASIAKNTSSGDNKPKDPPDPK
ncbi:hypothetical protein [Parafilimonas terrae]|jgi:hypothetical protein|uniref:Uncharacterized protein n=1 Tax=Parafilimonas terrae TaxID=1465490 RepID=A0A1I5U4D5_9BACT|nr:hypothetical protein [Parafilimonas terrae]SFP89777.1 hypothetical protein SAMN05444277_10341 [Parafilimonas terrae]